jgi:flagellar biosynthetic protein FlhB
MAGDDSQDQSQKTEEPTQHRLEEARKKGQIVFSREFITFVMFTAFTISLLAIGDYIYNSIIRRLAVFISAPHQFMMDSGNIMIVSSDAVIDMLPVFLIPMLILAFSAIAAGLMQTRFNISGDPLKPKLERISLMKGFGRVFSRKSLVEFLKGIVKITVIGVVCYYVLKPYFSFIETLPEYSLREVTGSIETLVLKVMLWVCIISAFMGGLDYLYQRYEYMKNNRMSIKDIREEFKQQEGDPHIKGKLKAIRAERARKRMMAEVPKADVVITNPTHYAVALKYDGKKMRAPMLVAKGADKVAQRIREVAEEHKVPIMRNPPLTRALYEAVDLDEEIPLEHYKAVAEVISYVYKLKGKNFGGGSGAGAGGGSGAGGAPSTPAIIPQIKLK